MLNRKLSETVLNFLLKRKRELEGALAELRANPPRFGDDLERAEERLSYVVHALQA